MSVGFYESEACASRRHCDACRNNPKFRASVVRAYGEPAEVDYPCVPLGLPIGVPAPPATPAAPRVKGPGTRLKELLTDLGFEATAACRCDAYARQMDAWGDSCWEHADEILEWLAEQAEVRGVGFWRPAARAVLWLAVTNAWLGQTAETNNPDQTPVPG